MNRRSMTLDYSGVKTYDAGERVNLGRIDNLKRPGEYQVPAWGNEDFDELIERIQKAKKNGSLSLSMWSCSKIKTSSSILAILFSGRDTDECGTERIQSLITAFI